MYNENIKSDWPLQIVENERAEKMKEYTMLASGTGSFNAWLKKYPNPLDLNEIHHFETLRVKENSADIIYYVNIKAMSEKTLHGRIAFVGITIRKGSGFELATREEEKDIKQFLADKIKAIANHYDCYYSLD